MLATTNAETLLRAILLDPADDLARLAYADALEEEGDRHTAAFVRKAVSRPDLYRRWRYYVWPNGEGEWQAWDGLLDRQADQFPHSFSTRPVGRTLSRKLLTGVPATHGLCVTIRRGLVESVRCTLAAWLEHGVALCARHPVTTVEVTGDAAYRIAEFEDTHQWGHHAPDELLPHVDPVGGLWYATEADARAALSLACVNWARGANGLPPLPAPCPEG